MAALAGPAQAATLTVTNTNDSGTGSLRQAIITANGNGQADTINITATGTVVLRSKLPDLATEMQVRGPGADRFTVSANGNYRAFRVLDRARVSISGVRITKGDGDGMGGGIYNTGVLTVERSTISGNEAYSGGGIQNEKSDVTPEGGTLIVKNSTISGNSAEGYDVFGGGIYNDGGTLAVENSTITGNAADRGGGVCSNISLPGQKTTITNSTIAGNLANSFGGGLYNYRGVTTVKFSTIGNNTAPQNKGSGVANRNGKEPRTEVSSSIVAGNRGTDMDVISAFSNPLNNFVSTGYNLVGNGNATSAFRAQGDLPGASARQAFGADAPRLAANGGPTQTVALQAGSGAIDRVPAGTNGCARETKTDQRGAARPRDGDGNGSALCDVGAFERETAPPPPPDATPPQTSLNPSGPSGTVNTASARFGFSSEAGATFECKLDGGSFRSCSSPKSYAGLSNGKHTFSVRARDAAGNVDPTPATRTWTVDTVRPAVRSVAPANRARNVAARANVTATFSEPMRAATLTRGTVKLVKRGTSGAVPARVSYDARSRKVTLNPNRNLVAGARYTATVTTGAKDAAGNPLSRSKTWSFTVRR